MNFILKPKHDGRELNLEVPFTGSRNEVYQRAKTLASGLTKLTKLTFSVRVERSDAPAKPYEVTHTGHTTE